MDGEPDWVNELRAQLLQREDPWVILEGRQAVEAAVSGWWDVVGIVADEVCEWEPPDWSGLELLRRPRGILEGMGIDSCEHEVMGLARQPDEAGDVAGLMVEMDADALVVVCPRICEEAEAGRIIRCAAALGAKAVIFGREGVSPFERCSVSASSGGIFRMPVRVADGGQILRCLKTAGFQLLGGADCDGTAPLSDAEFDPGRIAVVISSEGEGLGSFWKAACDALVHVPVAAEGGSLDPGAACSVLLWELKRRIGEQAESEG